MATNNAINNNYPGITSGSNPGVGIIGEKIESVVSSASAITLSNNTAANVTSISLTAGVWDVSCICMFNGTVTGTEYDVSINTTSATNGTLGNNRIQVPISPSANTDTTGVIPAYRIAISSTTTTYLVATSSFTVGTLKAYGRLSATRVG